MPVQLPKKIDDRLKDAVVQVFFTTEIPLLPLTGYVYTVLSEMGFAYSDPIQLQTPFNKGAGVQITIDNAPTFFSDRIRIQILPQNNRLSLVFNINGKYMGWDEYFPVIKDVIQKLVDENILDSFTRVGVRYISEFPNEDLSGKVNYSFNLSGLDQSLLYSNFRAESSQDPYKILINLAFKNPPLAANSPFGTPIDHISSIDIDVIQEDFNIVLTDELFDYIVKIHQKEKELFFNLLTAEFLQTLNPEY